ncbi:MAG: tetratricopeptide repeat protein [Bacteroidaceae bacterium]|nr:tetratricopeptide repeat protein [Bacteroidaceae bacterium]
MFFITGGSFFVCAQVNTEAVMTIGRNALYYEDYALSIQYFNQVITAKPHLYAPYYYRGIAKYYLGDYDGTIEDCTMSMERDPYIPGVYKLRAISNICVENYEAASRDYYALINDFNLKDRATWYNLVLCQSRLKQNDEADRLLDSMIVVWPDYPRSYMLKAQVAIDRGDTISADTLLQHTLALDSTDVDAMSVLGSLSLAQGLNERADSIYSRAMEISPRQTRLYVNRALARYRLTDLRGAMSDYNAAIEIAPENYIAHYNRALLRMQVGENNLAIEDFDFVLNRHPDDRLALYNRAILAQQTGDFKRAIEIYTTIIKEFPDFAGAYLNRSYCYRKVGENKKSEADDRTIIDLQLNLAYTKTEAVNPLDTLTRSMTDKDIEDYDKIVTDNSEDMAPIYASEHRGLIQNKEVVVEYQPLFSFTFFKADNGLNEATMSPVAFVDRANAVDSLFAIIYLSTRELAMTDEQCLEIGEWRKKAASRLHQAPDDCTLLFAHALYLAAERDYDYALSQLDKCERLKTDSSRVGVESVFLRSMVKVKIAELRSSKSEKSDKIEKSDKPEMPADDAAKRYAAAISDLTLAIRQDEHCSVFYYNRATLYCLSGEYAKAIEDFDKALELDPGLAEAYYNRGLAKVYSKNTEEGLVDLGRAGEKGLYTAYSLIKHFRKNK